MTRKDSTKQGQTRFRVAIPRTLLLRTSPAQRAVGAGLVALAAGLVWLAASTGRGPAADAGAPGAAGAEDMRSAAAAWVIFQDGAGFAPMQLHLDPPPLPGAPDRMTARCQGRITASGAAYGTCDIRDAEGQGWQERFDCAAGLAAPAVPVAWAGLVPPPDRGCLGHVQITGGIGPYAGLTAQGLFRLVVMEVTPQGQVIGLALRQYGPGF